MWQWCLRLEGKLAKNIYALLSLSLSLSLILIEGGDFNESWRDCTRHTILPTHAQCRNCEHLQNMHLADQDKSLEKNNLCKIIIIIQQFALQVRSLVQSQFSTDSDLALPFFTLQYPLVSLTPSSSCIRLLRRLPVSSILPAISPMKPCFRRQFLRKKGPTIIFLYEGRLQRPNPNDYAIHRLRHPAL